jgi:thioredoxin-related protein
MMTKKTGRLALAVLLAMTVSIPLWAQSGKIKWIEDYDDGLKAAQKTGQNLFVLITAPDWCKWCVELEKNTLPDPEVIELISEGFVPVKLLDGHPDIKKFTVEGYPTMMIISPQGKILATMPGYSKPAGLIQWCFKLALDASETADDMVDDDSDSDNDQKVSTGSIDAAMAESSGKMYFFKNGNCILYDLRRSQVVSGYPKPIETEFPGFTGTLRGAANAGNGYYYLFTDDSYFKFRTSSRKLENGFPKPFDPESWPGLGSLAD